MTSPLEYGSASIDGFEYVESDNHEDRNEESFAAVQEIEERRAQLENPDTLRAARAL